MSERRARPASENRRGTGDTDGSTEAKGSADSGGPGGRKDAKTARRSLWRRALTPPSAPPPRPAAPHEAPPAPDPAEVVSVVQSALYRDGVRVSTPGSLAETFRELREQPDGMAWIGLARPTAAELHSLAAEFDLHPLAVEDAMEAHQRPKLERYGETLFVVLSAARYLDAAEEVDFGELHVFVGPDFVITVRHGAAPDLSAVRRRMESSPELLRLGPEAVLYAILDSVVDGYVPVVFGVQNDVDEIETEVFRGDPAVSRRIYELSREMVEFQRATRPLVGMLHSLMGQASPSTARTRSSSATCATSPTTSRTPASGSTDSARPSPTSSPSTRPSSPSNRTPRCGRWRRRASSRTRRSRRSRAGRRFCSLPHS